MPSSYSGAGEDDALGIGPLVDLWSWGVDTSRTMSERVLDMYQELGSSAIGAFSGDVEAELRNVRLDIERLADLSVQVFDRLLGLLSRIRKDDGHAVPTTDRLTLRLPAGQTASACLWVHNISAEDHRVPRVQCVGLTTANGGHVLASTVRVDSSPIAPGNSRKLTLEVEAPTTAPRGSYHGLLVSDASADSVIVVTVEVVDPEDRYASSTDVR